MGEDKGRQGAHDDLALAVFGASQPRPASAAVLNRIVKVAL